jgi:hypothetical protein
MSDESTKPTARAMGTHAVRALMQRLARARGNDDGESGQLVLMVLRMIALERRTAMIVELYPQDTGLLLTIEEPDTGFWHGELLAIAMPTMRRALEDTPELLHVFAQSEHEGTITLRSKPTSPTDALAARMTPVALPSLGLLLEAGLLSGPSPLRGEISSESITPHHGVPA